MHQTWRPALAIFFLALALRLIMIGWPSFYTGIESMHIPSTLAYVDTGHFDPENDHATPLRKFLLYPFLRLLGDTATARRLPNAFFGALTAFFVVLLGRQLFPGSRIGVLAGLFLATDPFHISFSRSTWEDIPVALFVTAGLYFLAKALAQTSPDRYLKALLWSGAAFSLALATRRYTAALLLALFLWLAYRDAAGPIPLRGKELSRRVAFLAAVFLVLPLTVYAVTFYPWFGRGNSVGDWVSFQKHQVKDELTDKTIENEGAAEYYGRSYGAYDWFDKLIVFGSQMPIRGGGIATAMVINNPFSWFVVLPGLIWLAVLWRRTGSTALAIVIVGFLLMYLPFLAARRIILVYSVLSVLPFAFLIAASIFEIMRAREEEGWRSFGTAMIALVLATNILFYPLAVAIPLPKRIAALIPFQNRLERTDQLAPPESP